MSQEDVCKLWVALYPTLPDSYSKIRFPEQMEDDYALSGIEPRIFCFLTTSRLSLRLIVAHVV